MWLEYMNIVINLTNYNTNEIWFYVSGNPLTMSFSSYLIHMYIINLFCVVKTYVTKLLKWLFGYIHVLRQSNLSIWYIPFLKLLCIIFFAQKVKTCSFREHIFSLITNEAAQFVFLAVWDILVSTRGWDKNFMLLFP